MPFKDTSYVCAHKYVGALKETNKKQKTKNQLHQNLKAVLCTGLIMWEHCNVVAIQPYHTFSLF